MIDAGNLKQQLGKLPNWKACGPDKVHGFWIKEFTNIHEKIITHFNKCLENGKTPECSVANKEIRLGQRFLNVASTNRAEAHCKGALSPAGVLGGGTSVENCLGFALL